MEEYFTTLIATAEAIQATKDDDLTAADQEAIKRYRETFKTSLSEPARRAVKIVTKGSVTTYTIYKAPFYKEAKKAYLRQKAAQEIINFYRNPMLNGGHEIVEDTLTYIRSISLDDFEKHISVERSKLDADHGTESASLEQQFLDLEQYGHTISAAEQFLYGLIDLLATAIEKLEINDNQKVQNEIKKVARKWKSEWEQAGTDDTATMNQLWGKITRNRRVHWANERFSDPNKKGTFSKSFFYQDAKKHVLLFDRKRFKIRLKEFEEQGTHYTDSKASAIQFIKDYWLEEHYYACKVMGMDTQELDDLVERVAALFYDPQQPTAELAKWSASYWPSLHGKASDAMALMARRKMQKDPYSEAASITSKDVKLIIREIDKISGKMGVSTHKLLSTAIAEFTSVNNTGLGSQRDLRTGRVLIPLKPYAAKCGYDVYEHPATSAEDAEKEAKRAKIALDNARRKIKKDLQMLLSAKLSWEEEVKGSLRNFDEINILGRGSIRNGKILVEFSNSMAEYLMQMPLTQYPTALLMVDERNNSAYSMGLQMAEHYSIDNNQIVGTANLLKVKTLLKYTTIPTIEEMRAQRKSWEERIKEPFEKALDELTRCGLLADWRYSKSKGKELTFEEATNFVEYEDWAETLVWFELKDAPDLTTRIEARQKEKKAKRTKRKTIKKSN